MVRIVQGDPRRVRLCGGWVNVRLVESWRADPHRAVWWPEDDWEDIDTLAWLNEHAMPWTTEVGFPQSSEAPSADAIGQAYEAFVVLPDADTAAAFVAWSERTAAEWAVRHATLSPDDIAYCVGCGGPADEMRPRTHVIRVVDVEISYTAPDHWCSHCGHGDRIAVRSSGWDQGPHRVNSLVRSHFGIPKGQRPPQTEGPARIVIMAGPDTTDAEVMAALVM